MCKKDVVASSNEWNRDGEQGGGTLDLEDVTNFL